MLHILKTFQGYIFFSQRPHLLVKWSLHNQFSYGKEKIVTNGSGIEIRGGGGRGGPPLTLSDILKGWPWQG